MEDGGLDALPPAEGDETRIVSLYKVKPSIPFSECWHVNNEDEAGNYTDIELEGLGDEALLVEGRATLKEIEWTRMVRDLSGLPVEYETAEASAVLFVATGGESYALTFGGGWRMLKGVVIDRDFGLNFALRAIDSEEVRHLKRHSFSASSRVDINSVPAGQALWSFGIREHAELVRQIAGKAASSIDVKLTHIQKMAGRRGSRISFDCTDRIRVPLPHSPKKLVADLTEVSRILREVDVSSDLESLTWIRRINPQESDIIEEAWLLLMAALREFDDEQVSLAYPSKYHGGPEIGTYQGTIAGKSINKSDLVLDDIRERLEDRPLEQWRRALKNGFINGHDDDGKTVGGDESAENWLSGQVDLKDGQRLVLLDGDWFDLTDKYISSVDRLVRTALHVQKDWALPAWSDAPLGKSNRREEKEYNEFVQREDPRFLCLDRKLVRTRAHKRGFEACDLLGPDNELIHVKKVSSQTGSGPLSHLFAQGIVSVESLTDRGTWDDFVKLVREQDAERAEKLGHRPHAMVYAIHRSNGPLTADNMFTFAKSELASASMIFSKLGVELSIVVIP